MTIPISKWPKALRQRISRWLVARSGLFDASYYLAEYPDVATAGLAPLAHYCDHGWREERRPGPMVHPDYVSTGPIGRHFAHSNPIIIWLLVGRWMGWALSWPQLQGWTPPTVPMQGGIAIVVHAATRTGAPIFALRLARWMRRKGYADPTFILLADGSLLPEMWDEFPCLPLFALAKSERSSFLRAMLPNARILYLNSLASLSAWEWLDWHEGGLLLHVHESAASMSQYAAGLATIASSHPRTIAVSEDCRAPLTQMLGREPDIIPPAIEIPLSAPKECPRIGPKIVMGCGTMSRRKGADLFCEVAAQVLERFGEEVEFRWLGGVGDVDMEEALKCCGIPGQVKLAGEVADPSPHFATANLFILPSRDDPFPLVALEAASYGIPVVCFDALAEGVGTWISNGAGEVVPAFDISAMADAAIRLLADPAWHRSASAAAREAAKSFDIDKIGGRIGGIINQVAEESAVC